MKINIIMDDKKSWAYKKIPSLTEAIKKHGHSCFFLTKQKEIQKGSDVSFFLSCKEHISKGARDKSRYNIIIHGSDLPKGRGISPVTWQILEGKNKIPVTLFEVADRLDEGDYYFKDRIMLDGTELYDDWKEKEFTCAKRMILKFLKLSENLKPKKQKGRPSFYGKRIPSDGKLDINLPIKEQINMFRVADNEKYPTFFIYKNKRYTLKVYEDKMGTRKK